MPAVAGFLLLSAIVFIAGDAVRTIGVRNETVRDFNDSVAEAQLALVSARRLGNLAARWNDASLNDRDQLHFDYLDVYRTLEDLFSPEGFLTRIPKSDRTKILMALKDLSYSEKLDTRRVLAAAESLIPALDSLGRSLRAHKRDAYVAYYNNVLDTTQSLDRIFAGVFFLALAGVLPLALVVGFRLDGRLKTLACRVWALAVPEGTPSQNPGSSLQSLSSGLSALDRRFREESTGGRLVDALDEERRRIARDMHDQVLTELTALTRVAEALHAENRNGESPDPGGLRNLKQGLVDLAGDIRAVIDDLYPPIIDTMGLVPALEAHVGRLQQRLGEPGLILSIEADCAKNLEPHRALAVYKIALEALGNAIRHAGADQIEIDFHRDGRDLCLTVEDNGSKVMGTAPPEFSEGRGMAGMRYRAARINGTVSWKRSRFSTGTRFEVRVPVL